MQAQQIVKQHLGKWLKVDDVVQDVVEYSSEIRVSTGNLPNPIVLLDFNKEYWLETLETLSVDDRIAAEGKISSVSLFTIALEDCEILQLQGTSEAGSQVCQE